MTSRVTPEGPNLSTEQSQRSEEKNEKVQKPDSGKCKINARCKLHMWHRYTPRTPPLNVESTRTRSTAHNRAFIYLAQSTPSTRANNIEHGGPRGRHVSFNLDRAFISHIPVSLMHVTWLALCMVPCLVPVRSIPSNRFLRLRRSVQWARSARFG